MSVSEIEGEPVMGGDVLIQDTFHDTRRQVCVWSSTISNCHLALEGGAVLDIGYCTLGVRVFESSSNVE